MEKKMEATIQGVGAGRRTLKFKALLVRVGVT